MSPEQLLDGLPVSLPDFCTEFDFDIGIALKGVACRSNGEPFFFSSTKDLPSNTFWISDIGQPAFFDKIGPGHNFAHRDFLGEPLSIIAAQYCLEFETSQDCLQSAKILSRIAARVVLAVNNLTPLKKFSRSAMPISLAQWIQQSLLDFDGYESAQLVGDLFMRDIVKTAVNMPAVSAPNQHSEAEDSAYYLGQSRVNFIESLCDLRTPSGAWSDLSVDTLVGSVGDKINFLLDLDQPVMAQVVIHSPSLALTKLTREGLRSGSKRWVSENELALLGQLAVISILQVRVCERYIALNSALLQPLRPLLAAERASLAYQIASHAIAQAVCSPSSNNGTYFATSRMVWASSFFRTEVLSTYLRSSLPACGNLESYDIGSLIWSPDNQNGQTFDSMLLSVSEFDIQKRSPDKDIHVIRTS